MTNALSFAFMEDSDERCPRCVVHPIPSLIKWTGSKRSQALAIVKLMPPYKHYIEPFLGGGALLYAAAVPGSIAGDIYQPLIELWKLIQHSPAVVIENYQKQWSALGDELDSLDPKNLPLGEVTKLQRIEKLEWLLRTLHVIANRMQLPQPNGAFCNHRPRRAGQDGREGWGE